MKRQTIFTAVALAIATLILVSALYVVFRPAPALSVRNINTGLRYSTIQRAIDASETADGHTLVAASGVYYENVVVNKSLSIIGADPHGTIIDGQGEGTLLYLEADGVYVSNLTVQNGKYGIRLYHSKNSRLDGNNIYNNAWFGLDIDHSGNCTLRNNNLTGNTYNFGVDGAALPDFINDIDSSNRVDGKLIYYLINQSNLEIDASTFSTLGYLGLVNSTNIRIKDLDIRKNVDGLLFAYVTDSTIEKANVTNNWNGIYVKYSSNIAILDNNVDNNFDYAIALRSSTNCTVARNSANTNSWGGISLGATQNSTVSENSANDNYYCIHLVDSENNLVMRNTAYRKNDGYSIAIYRSNNNTIYHNNFVNSLLYTPVKSTNTLDNGQEGNYWRDYSGTDQNLDGIGDTPYILGEDNRDTAPLMGEISTFEIAWKEETYTIAAVTNATITQFRFDTASKSLNFTVTAEDRGEYFHRVAAPSALLQDLENLTVLINGEQPHLQNTWADETHTYLYCTYTHNPTFDVTIVGVLLLLLVSLSVSLAFVFLRKMRHPLPSEKRD